VATDPKSPQEKKRLEYTKGHFTYGRESSRNFPKVWRRKKAMVQRQFRRQGNELLVRAKLGLPAEDVTQLADEVTTERITKFTVTKRLKKNGTVTIGEKVRLTLERREAMAGYKAQVRDKYDRLAAESIQVLTSLQGDELAVAAHLVSRLSRMTHSRELRQLGNSANPAEKALYFCCQAVNGSLREMEALRRNPNFCQAWTDWIDSANRIIQRERRPLERKAEQRVTNEKKISSLQRARKRQPSEPQ
jgi:hypothetical protein